MVEIVKKPRAVQDLIDLATYLYQNEPDSDVSERFLSASEDAFRQISEFPGMGAAYQTRSRRLAGLRQWSVPAFPNHLIFYRAAGDRVEIIRVLHGARNLRRALLEDEEAA